MNVGLLHDRRDGLLGQPARLEKARKVAALAQLGDAKLHRAGPRLPVALAVAVALRKAIGRALAMRRSRAAFDVQLHQPLGRKADHSAQKVRVGGLLQKRLKRHSFVGHRRVPRLRCDSQPDPTGEPTMTTASRSLATALWGARFASGLLRPSYTTSWDTTRRDPAGGGRSNWDLAKTSTGHFPASIRLLAADAPAAVRPAGDVNGLRIGATAVARLGAGLDKAEHALRAAP